MRIRHVTLFGLSVAVFCQSVQADVKTNVWANKTDVYASFGAGANWQGGVVPNMSESARLNETYLFTNKLSILQQTYLNTPSANTPSYVGTLVGGAGYVIGGTGSLSSRVQWLQDATDFLGAIGGVHCNDSKGGGVWVLQSTPEKPAGIRNLRANNMASVGVVNANATGIVHHVYGEGQYGIPWKNGVTSVASGTMEVKEFLTGRNGNAYVTTGRALVHGRTAEPAVVGTPYIHLDAKATSTMTLAPYQGTNYVSRWEDVRGNGFALVQNESKQLPFLSTDAASGFPVVDFGGLSCSRDEAKARYGKPATMIFNDGGRSDIHEIFVVFKDAWTSCGNGNVMGQNLLCSAPAAPQYFARTFTKRTSSNFYMGGLFAGQAAASGQSINNSGYAAPGPVLRGDVRVNGMRTDPGYADDFSRSLYVVSAGTSEPTAADRLGENGAGQLGGIAYAEILVYTNELTSAERRQVNDYLRAKWQSAEMSKDYDNGWTSVSSGATLEVADGTYVTARLTVGDTTFAKNGAGDLEVQDFNGNATALQVNGGHLALRKPALSTLPDDRPAADPEFWFDATKGITSFHSNNVDYVTRWDDARPGGINGYGYTIYAARPSSGICPPTIRENFSNGLPGLDFGPLRTACGNGSGRNWTDGVVKDSSCFTISFNDPGNVNRPLWQFARDIFMVIAANENTTVPFIGSTDFYNTGTLVGGNSALSRGALWRCDGLPVNPGGKNISDGQVYVVNVRLPEDYGPSQGHHLAFYPSGWGNGYMGNVVYGECLYYPYVLTDEERRQTEAYLLKKWKNAVHPDVKLAEKSMAFDTVTFSSDVDPVVDTDYDTTVGALTSPSGAVVKKGSGDLTVHSMNIGVDSYDIQGGSLETSADWLADAALHMDASKEDTIVYVAGQEADRRIAKWYDCRGNGQYAQSPLSYTAGGGTHPITNAVYAATTDATSGLLTGSKYIDFGTGSDTSACGGMYWYTAGGSRRTLTNTREYHVVFSITSRGNYQPIGGPKSPGEDAIVPSSYLDSAFYNNCTRARSSRKMQDGSDWFTDNRYTKAAGSLDTTKFYITSLQFSGDVQANSFAIDRANCGFGNVKLCEAIVFTGNTNSMARCKAIHEYLRKKWKGESAEGMGEPLPIELASVNVESGATLSIDSGESGLSTKVLTGAGTVIATGGLEITATQENPYAITAEFTAPNVVNCITVNGPLTLPAYGTVTLSTADGVKPEIGFYPILSATSLTGNIVGWTFNASDASKARIYSLRKQGNQIGVMVSGVGLSVIVK